MKRKYLYFSILPLSLVPLPFVISCTSSQANSTLPDNSKLTFSESTFGKNVVLYKDEYNRLYDEMVAKGQNYVAIAIIANHKIYEQIIPFVKGDKVWDILQKSDYEFNTYNAVGLGIFINSFRLKSSTEGMHGTRELTNYGDYYPLYYINHSFSEFGVSNGTTSAHEIYEITYDDK